ncbi:hypothetical protein BJP25_26835 [Actinokineospora bangkokensis]|uniref:DUF3558 domain-containing protein n=1 Tax=Actinokineospora bangkokensis TaxID=1193682 RepID=A0A1Q9LGZ6_9PSEU|nr:hypothetical protein BJP25_26835 [Actinokineospora bangkokensis]
MSAAVAVLVLSGCGVGSAPGAPVVGVAGRPTTPPAVAKSLDLAAASDPCAAVPRSIPLGLGVYGDGQPHEGGGQRYCVWADKVDWPRITVAFSSADPLAEAYRDAERPDPGGDGLRWKLFEPTAVDGQPALVRAQRTDGSRLCEVVVGTGGGGGIVVSAGASGPSDTGGQCRTAVSAANEVVSSLRA